MPDFELVPIDHNPFADMQGMITRPSGAQQWQSAIEEQRLREAQKPSMGTQIADIANNTVRIMGAPIFNQAQRMADMATGKINLDDPEQVKEASGGTLLDMMGLVGGTAGAAERGTVGALGGKPPIVYHQTDSWNGGDILPLEKRLGKEKALEEFSRRWPLVSRQQAGTDIGLVYTTDNALGHGQGNKVIAIDASKVPDLEWFMHPDETDGGWVSDRIPAGAIIGHTDDPMVLRKIKSIEQGIPDAGAAERGTVGAMGGKLPTADRQMLQRAAQSRAERIVNDMPTRDIEPKLIFSRPTREHLEWAAEKKANKDYAESNRADMDATEAIQNETFRRGFIERGQPIPDWAKPGPKDMTYDKLSPEARRIYDAFVGEHFPHWNAKRLPPDTSVSLPGYHWENGKLVEDLK